MAYRNLPVQTRFAPRVRSALFDVIKGRGLLPIGTRLTCIGIEDEREDGHERCLIFERPGGGRPVELYPAVVRAVTPEARATVAKAR